MNYRIILLIILGVSAFVFNAFTQELPTEKSSLFSGSGNCVLCHSASAGVLTNSSGRDVSPIFHWQSSMMGNASKDPYWQAKVSSEVEENPQLKEIIEDKCATCHAPMGRTEAIYSGDSFYSFEELTSDPLSMDGVSCTLCHQISSENLASSESFTGGYIINPVKKMYGPYLNPFPNSMVNITGFTPAYSAHISSSALCATCHTLSTPYVNENGEVSGHFPEQMPYFEWLNSIYPGKDISCQQCHMPVVNESMKIASIPPNLQNLRKPIYEHHFVGGNTVMVELITENYHELGINSGMPNLDSTLHHAIRNLQQNSVELSVDLKSQNNMIAVEVKIRNKTGHKLPTGFPSRRLWLHFIATTSSGEVVFESGKYDKEGKIVLKSEYEEHHDTISNEENVQIYEAVMGNTSDEVTTILLEASQYLKDNRLPPIGFVNKQPYDSLIAISGKAKLDKNFNKSDDGIEGSGSDQLTYYFPFSGSELIYKIELCYQSIKPDFAEHLSHSQTDESEHFTEMYSDAALQKVQVLATFNGNVNLTGASSYNQTNWMVYPNPTSEIIYINGIFAEPINYTVYTMDGSLVSNGQTKDSAIPLQEHLTGAYILEIASGERRKAFKIYLF